jgi:hypothetical protein
MNIKHAGIAGAALLGVATLASSAESAPAVGAARNGATVKISRLYTGPDGKTHVEYIEALGPGKDMYKLLAAPGAELRRTPPGRVQDWHPAPRRQYVITLSGNAEVELEDGTIIKLGPGSIDLAEDLTGKGHITRTVGTEDRVTLAIPVADR